jgi:uncharacterized protein YneF (UPF0154 family)
MSEQPSKETKVEEIDLLELFQRIGKSIRKGINWIINLAYQFFLLILRKSIWIGVSMIIGISVGISLFFVTQRFYASEMVARANVTENNFVVNAINQLNDLCIDGNYSALAKYLETNELNASKIKSIKAGYGIDINADGITDYVDYENKVNPKDTNIRRLSKLFYVRVEVYDETGFATITEGTKKYIWKNPFIAENNTVRKQQAMDMINSYNLEIRKLDSLQKSYYFTQLTQRAGNGQMMFLNEKEVKLFHRDMIALVSEKQSIEKALLVDPDPITIVQDFTPLSRTENPWTKYVKKWGLAFALLGFIIAVFWQYKSSIYTFIKENK